MTLKIEMIGFDEDRTVRDEVATGLHHVHIRLNTAPPWEWEQLFDERRKSPRYSMRRRASVQGEYIVIRCALDELERYHFGPLKEDIDYVNRAYAAKQEADERQRLAAEAAASAEKEHVSSKLGSIRIPGASED